MKNRKSKVLICAGLLLIAGAFCLIGYNAWDARRAAGSVQQIVRGLETQMNTTVPADSDDSAAFSPPAQAAPTDGLTDELNSAAPADRPDAAAEMPTVELDGNEYIGILEIPSLKLSLPVMRDWSYAKLKLAPCRYTGSVAQGDLVIAAHNYAAHFGALGSLSTGACILFTDAADNVFTYTVSEIEELPATALEEMQNGDWDLTLFTCTVSGKARIAVRCELVPDSSAK